MARKSLQKGTRAVVSCQLYLQGVAKLVKLVRQFRSTIAVQSETISEVRRAPSFESRHMIGQVYDRDVGNQPYSMQKTRSASHLGKLGEDG